MLVKQINYAESDQSADSVYSSISNNYVRTALTIRIQTCQLDWKPLIRCSHSHNLWIISKQVEYS